jgi:cyclophilin family peptidyl-prolyl cis-trans isomerase
MASTGPNNSESQFFINIVKTHWLGRRHVVFWKVAEGTDGSKKIEAIRAQSGRPSKKVVFEDSGELTI